MVEALHLGSVGLAAAGAGCAAAAGGRGGDKLRGVLTALLMLIAMIDTTLHPLGVPTVGWALVLILAAIASGIIGDRPDREPGPSRAPSPTHLMLHRNVGLILMAGLVVVMTGHPEGGTDGHAAHAGANLLYVVLVGGSALYLAISIWLAVRSTETAVPHRLETASMGLSILTMGAAWLI